MRRTGAGYSLFELVILIVVLSIVCFFIFVASDSLNGERPEELEKVAAEMIRIGIHNYAILSKRLEREPVYPIHLDEAEAGALASDKTPLFTELFPDGIRSGWRKVQENQYVYEPTSPGPVLSSDIYYYDPLRGSFEKGKPARGGRLASLTIH